MRCPYQTKVIHQPEYKEGYTTHFAADITVFCECFGEECPFYYTTYGDDEHCRKAESENKNEGCTNY